MAKYCSKALSSLAATKLTSCIVSVTFQQDRDSGQGGKGERERGGRKTAEGRGVGSF